MSQPLSRQPPTAGDLLHWIATKNPFYAISAALVLWGLWVSFGKQNDAIETWLLMGSLAGYTLLLAATAFVLVRYLNQWDDTRTLLLLVVLLLLATSVSFDHVLETQPARGTACYVLGLGLALAISEALLRGLHLRLPLLYRLPYYLILGLFFLYPLFVRLLLDADNPTSEPFLWALFGFSTAAALAWLTLLPALRRGQDYVRDNGSTWPWPLYPWSLFIVLAVAVPGRALLMCWSLHPQEGIHFFDRLIFGPYFLVPFGFALAVLLLEMGLTLPRTALVGTALGAPLVLLLLASIGHSPADPVYRVLRVMTVSIGKYRAFDPVQLTPDPIYSTFRNMFAERLHGDPLFLTLVLSACFYVYAALRGVRFATSGLALALGALAVVAPDSLTAGLRASPAPWPLLAAAAIEFTVGIRRHEFWHTLAGSLWLAAALATALPLPETSQPDLRPGLFAQFIVLALLTLGALFTDQPAFVLRTLGAGGVVILSLLAMHTRGKVDALGDLTWLQVVYPLVMVVMLVVYGRLLRHTFSELLAVVLFGWWLFLFSRTGYRSLRQKVPGLDAIVAGLAFFGVAILVSLAKSGVLKWRFNGRWEWPRWLQPTATPLGDPATSPPVPLPVATGGPTVAPLLLPPAPPPVAPAPTEAPAKPEQGQPPVSGEGSGPG
jgi:hypothetical protein